MTVSVIIPCYNEEESIADVVKAIPREVAEIIVVDNNSTDRSAEIALAAGARVVKESRQGYGAALKAGFANATGDVIVTLDGDKQYPAYKIPDLVKELSENKLDFISGSRFPLKDRTSLSITRIFGNYLLTFFADLLFLLPLRDSQSGMWIFKKNILRLIPLESDDMPLSEEIKIKAALHPQIKFAERHIPYHPRSGESKLFPMRHGFMNLAFLFKMRLKNKKS